MRQKKKKKRARGKGSRVSRASSATRERAHTFACSRAAHAPPSYVTLEQRPARLLPFLRHLKSDCCQHTDKTRIHSYTQADKLTGRPRYNCLSLVSSVSLARVGRWHTTARAPPPTPLAARRLRSPLLLPLVILLRARCYLLMRRANHTHRLNSRLRQAHSWCTLSSRRRENIRLPTDAMRRISQHAPSEIALTNLTNLTSLYFTWFYLSSS